MDRNEMRKMLGMESGGAGFIYKLNKVTMSGDDGSFRFTDLVSERTKGDKPNIEDLGKTIQGVILKMRWQLTKFQESGSLSSTEYDDKWRDEVTVYPMRDTGSVSDMKEKYGLSTIRILYVYLPVKQQIVRVVVKASALTGQNNPNGENGLFEYLDGLASDDVLPCEVMTIFKGIHRPDPKGNKRKDYFAMMFERGTMLTEEQFAKVQTLMIEVSEKISAHVATKQQEEKEEYPGEKALEEALTDYPAGDMNPDDIPF